MIDLDIYIDFRYATVNIQLADEGFDYLEYTHNIFDCEGPRRYINIFEYSNN